MKIFVLGLGPSIRAFRPTGHITVGVNDIARHVTPDILVTADPPGRFTPERRHIIATTESRVLVSMFREWYGIHPRFRLIQSAKGRGILDDLDSPRWVFSNHSTFVAIVMAYKLGATEIETFGMDFSGHPALSKPHMIKTAITDLVNLRRALAARGVTLRACSESPMAEHLNQ